jgi:hypothetical protein
MPVHLKAHLAAGRHVPGIFILNSNMSIGQTARALALTSIAASPDEYADQLTYLHLNP